MYEATRTQGLEGVVAKRLDSPYRPGVRTKLWIKTKHYRTEQFVVGGVVVGKERCALLVGTPAADGRLHYVGPVEIFARSALAPILERATARSTSPFVGWAPRGLYLEPGITVEVRYLASDASGLRRATLVG